MTNDELRSAIKYFKGDVRNDMVTEIHINPLIDLAERVIEIGESCPKAQPITSSGESLYKACGYNQARADMLLWVAGKLGGVEELCNDIHGVRYLTDDEDRARAEIIKHNNKILAKCIRQLFGVKD